MTTRVSSATGTNTATLGTHAAGDLILVFAFRDGSTTAPSLPAGFTNVANAGANTCSARVGYKIAASGAESVGTWTNATSVIAVVYRPSSGKVLSIGSTPATNTASSTTINYPALTMDVTDGSSWVVGFAGHRSVDTSLETAPTGMTNFADVVDATDEAAAHDTNAGVSSWSSQNVAAGGTASGYRSYVVEIVEQDEPPWTWDTGSGKPAKYTLSNGNLTLTMGTNDGTYYRARAARPFASSGKWWCEFTWTSHASNDSEQGVGICNASLSVTDYPGNSNDLQLFDDGPGYLGSPGTAYYGNSIGLAGHASDYDWPTGSSTNFTFGMAYDADAGQVTFYFPDASTAGPYTVSGLGSSLYAAMGMWNTGDQVTINFGASAFVYTPPTGFVGPDAGGGSYTLTATGITVSSPVIGAPAITQTHLLATTALTVSSPVIATPTLVQVQLLAAVAIAVSSPVIGTPAIAQDQVLTATGLTVSSPVIGAPAFDQTHVMTAADLVVSSPALGQPAISQSHVLTAADLATGSPVLGQPALLNVNVLAADDLVVSSPVIGQPAITQAHVVTAGDFTTASPVIGQPALTQDQVLTATGLTVSSPALGQPALDQTHVLSAGAFSVGSPVFGAAALTQSHVLTVGDLTTSSPVLGTPILAEAGNLLTADDLIVSSPDLGEPAITQDHVLTASALTTSSPVIGTPALAQTHVLTVANMVVASPVLGAPSIAQAHVLSVGGFSTASPVLGQPLLSFAHVLTADGLSVGAPVIGLGVLTQSHVLTAASLATGSPVLGLPLFGQAHVLTADDVAAGAAVIGMPVFGQIHVLLADSIATGSPVLATPTIYLRSLRPRRSMFVIG